MFLQKVQKIYRMSFPIQRVGLTSIFIQKRNLYSRDVLGVTKYRQTRKIVENSIPHHAFLRQNLKKRISSSEYDLPRLELDLKNFLHLMENTERDHELLHSALQCLVEKRIHYDGYKYGFDAILMRVFYHYNLPDEALKYFDDEVLGQIFTQVTSYQILLDLLYEHGKYNDVLRIYDKLTAAGEIESNKFIDAIILATLFRMNTAESCKRALNMWSSMKDGQLKASRTFVAGLAVNQRHPEAALEIMKGENMYTAMVHINLMAWSQTGDFKEIFNMLNAIIDRAKDKNNPKKLTTSTEVFMVIGKSVQHRGVPEEINQFRKIYDEIKSLELITTYSFDEIICSPFHFAKRPNST